MLSLSQVKAGVMTEDDKKKQVLATKNIAKAFGQSTFSSALKKLRGWC